MIHSIIDHVAINVSDMEENLSIYRDLLGLEVLMDTVIPPCQSFEKLVGVQKAQIERILFLGHPQRKGMIELAKFSPYTKTSCQDATPQHVGLFLISFLVDDVEETYQEFVQKGVEFISPPQTLDLGEAGKCRAVLFHAPDGVMIELIQYGSQSGASA